MGINVTDFRSAQQNTRKGFIDLHLEPSGLVIKDAIWHECNGKEWVGLPSRARVENNELVRKPNGKPDYTNVIDFESKDQYRAFSDAAVKAIYRFLGKGAPPAPATDGHPFA